MFYIIFRAIELYPCLLRLNASIVFLRKEATSCRYDDMDPVSIDIFVSH
jgi:hypothetical protein